VRINAVGNNVNRQIARNALAGDICQPFGRADELKPSGCFFRDLLIHPFASPEIQAAAIETDREVHVPMRASPTLPPPALALQRIGAVARERPHIVQRPDHGKLGAEAGQVFDAQQVIADVVAMEKIRC